MTSVDLHALGILPFRLECYPDANRDSIKFYESYQVHRLSRNDHRIHCRKLYRYPMGTNLVRSRVASFEVDRLGSLHQVPLALSGFHVSSRSQFVHRISRLAYERCERSSSNVVLCRRESVNQNAFQHQRYSRFKEMDCKYR